MQVLTEWYPCLLLHFSPSTLSTASLSSIKVKIRATVPFWQCQCCCQQWAALDQCWWDSPPPPFFSSSKSTYDIKTKNWFFFSTLFGCHNQWRWATPAKFGEWPLAVKWSHLLQSHTVHIDPLKSGTLLKVIHSESLELRKVFQMLRRGMGAMLQPALMLPLDSWDLVLLSTCQFTCKITSKMDYNWHKNNCHHSELNQLPLHSLTYDTMSVPLVIHQFLIHFDLFSVSRWIFHFGLFHLISAHQQYSESDHFSPSRLCTN